MDNEKVKFFYETYMSMSEYQIFDIYTNKFQTLTEEARGALNLVISERGINIKSIGENIRTQDVKAEVAKKEKEQKKSIRDKKFEKIYFYIAIPIAILTVFINPGQSVQNVFTVIFKTIFVVAIWYVGKYVLKLLRIVIGAITSRSS